MLGTKCKAKGLVKFVTLLGIGVSLMGAGSVTANASSKNYCAHFDSRRITYHIDSTSKHYRGIWKSAVKAWNKEQKVIKLKSTKSKKNADIRMTTVSKNSNKVDYTRYWTMGDSIMNSSVRLNRHALDAYEFDNSTRVQYAISEIGFGLGLEWLGDTSKSSVMNQSQDNFHITSFDRANLKAAYKGVK
ncbi:hypothetical protein [Lactobacillus sp. HBUAS51381]|uniref:hypothetical protein n=1 Tax=Lactobacillus sp. HBUAS51381 TaxID=2722743 RepID=UPI001456C4E8|nr:hypothetical protein [Lactobacillus sp. HBUAS51381]NLR09192.1 hypothetical protein [Lactobacillus sp. HBUAS51381]